MEREFARSQFHVSACHCGEVDAGTWGNWTRPCSKAGRNESMPSTPLTSSAWVLLRSLTVCASVGSRMQEHVCGGQRTPCRRQFSLSAMWILGPKLGSRQGDKCLYPLSLLQTHSLCSSTVKVSNPGNGAPYSGLGLPTSINKIEAILHRLAHMNHLI